MEKENSFKRTWWVWTIIILFLLVFVFILIFLIRDYDFESTTLEEVEIEEKKECININTASRESLKEIVHINEVRVDDLINSRPFESIEELTRVDGIGSVRLEEIKEQGLVCLE